MERNDLELTLEGSTRRVVNDPPLALALFGGTRFAWLWLVGRVYLGWELLAVGRYRLQDSAWMGDGTALKQIWQEAARTPGDGGTAASGWHRDLLGFLVDHEWYSWIAPTIAITETLIGIALILGLFTGIAAFGGLMTFAVTLGGGTSANPLLLTIAVLLVLAWKTAGWIGLDHWALPFFSRTERGEPSANPSRAGIEPTNPLRATGS